jgi:hypothetical protein
MVTFLKYEDWLLNETRIVTAGWNDDDHAEWEKLHMENLGNLGDVCKKHKVKWWLDSGTLLGIHRDGHIIKGDSDTDIGIHCEDITPDFIADMEKHWNMGTINGMFYHHKDLVDLLQADKYVPIKNIKFSSLKTKNGQAVKYKGKEVWADVFIHFPWNKDLIYKYSGGYFRTKADVVGSPKTFQCMGVSLKRPEKVEDHLEIVYGKGWETPDPKYDPKKIDVYGGPLKKKDLGGAYHYNFVKKDFKIK